MRFLKNIEVLEKELITLINNAKKKITIISPYINIYYEPKYGGIKKWDEIYSLLRQKDKEGILIEIHARKNQRPDDREGNTIDEEDIIKKFHEINLRNIYLMENLHAKLYFNDNNAIITSLNLTSSSIFNKNIEIGFITENEKEYIEILKDFYFPVMMENNQGIRERRKEIFLDYIHFIQHDLKMNDEKTTDFKIYNNNFEINIRIEKIYVETLDTGYGDTCDHIGYSYEIYYDINILNDNDLYIDFEKELHNIEYSNIISFSYRSNNMTLMHQYGYICPITYEDIFLDDHLFFQIRDDILQIITIIKKYIHE